ncbi:MAG: FHA domain-containing protein [Chloroflexi bacterium]|nr:FHA domain-containing protein [Chloroflexota bacterium]
MAKPPDTDGPTDEQEPTSQDDETFDVSSLLEEPPLDDNATRPLKPVRIKRGASMPRRGGRPADSSPPATVLRSASSKDPTAPRRDRLSRLLDDTGRVRLVPKTSDPPPWRVIFQVTGPNGAVVGLDVRQPLVLGRRDPNGVDDPDVDLTPHLIPEHGISRTHAVLIPATEALFIADLDSTNGTWVNGNYVEPGERFPLATSDHIELGLMRLEIRSITPIQR